MTNKKRQINNRRYWQAHVKAHQESGLTRAEYCRQHNLSCSALSYWYKKLGNPKCNESTLVPVTLTKSASDHFTAPDQDNLKLIMPGNIKIEIGENFSAPNLVRLLSVLENR